MTFVRTLLACTSDTNLMEFVCDYVRVVAASLSLHPRILLILGKFMSSQLDGVIIIRAHVFSLGLDRLG